MSIKITSQEFDVTKGLGAVDNMNELVEITSTVQRQNLKPGLLTLLMAPSESFLQTTTFAFDIKYKNNQLPSGKSYSEVGADLDKNRSEMRFFQVPSFGVRHNVAPNDVLGQRDALTNQLMTPEQIVAEMNIKMIEGWDLFRELGIAQLITTDTNIVRGGPFTSYNMYTDIVGSARAPATTMQLASTTADHSAIARREVSQLRQELARAGLNAGRVVAICGENFFDARFEHEKQTGLNREMKYGPDFAQTAPLALSGGGFTYAYFDSALDGIRYINYGSEIIAGTKLIPTDNAYLIPEGSSLVETAYAPAITLSTVNKTAERRYAWTNVSERQGYTTVSESNVLFFNKNPRAVRHLTK